MARFTDLEDLDIKPSRNQIFDIAVNLMLKSISKEAFLAAFEIEVMPEEDIFNALIRSGKASNIFDAAAMIGRRFAPSSGSTWNDLAKWVAEYEAHSARKNMD
jgi:hypothetical protein